jgi:hypothetical protein
MESSKEEPKPESSSTEHDHSYDLVPVVVSEPGKCEHEWREEPDGVFIARSCHKCGFGQLLRA